MRPCYAERVGFGSGAVPREWHIPWRSGRDGLGVGDGLGSHTVYKSCYRTPASADIAVERAFCDAREDWYNAGAGKQRGALAVGRDADGSNARIAAGGVCIVTEEESEGLIGDAHSPGLYAPRGRSVGPEPVARHVWRGKPAAPRVAAPAVAARCRAGGRGRGGALVRGRRAMAAGHACAGRGEGTGFHRLGSTARRLAAASRVRSADGRTTGAVVSPPAAGSSSKQGSRSREQCPVGLAPGRATRPRGVGKDPYSSPRPLAAGHGAADAAVAGDAVASARRSPVGAAAVARTSDEPAPLCSGSASRVARTGGRPHWRGDGKKPVLAGVWGAR